MAQIAAQLTNMAKTMSAKPADAAPQSSGCKMMSQPAAAAPFLRDDRLIQNGIRHAVGGLRGRQNGLTGRVNGGVGFQPIPIEFPGQVAERGFCLLDPPGQTLLVPSPQAAIMQDQHAKDVLLALMGERERHVTAAIDAAVIGQELFAVMRGSGGLNHGVRGGIHWRGSQENPVMVVNTGHIVFTQAR